MKTAIIITVAIIVLVAGYFISKKILTDLIVEKSAVDRSSLDDYSWIDLWNFNSELDKPRFLQPGQPS